MIFLADKKSIEQLIEYVAIREPRREDDIVQICGLYEIEKAKIIATNTTWLTVGFANYHLTLPIAKALSKNKTIRTLIFEYGCSFDDGVFIELAKIATCKKLLLPESRISNEQVIEILNCKQWDTLDFYSCKLTDAVLKSILNDQTWKTIQLAANSFCQENYKVLDDLDELYKSYIFDETLSYEQKEKMIRVIYISGAHLHHKYFTPQ